MDGLDLPSFTPVPLRARRDGWTPERQRTFIAALQETRCIAKAAAAVGMARETAYRLRERPGAASFAAAWDSVFAAPRPHLEVRPLTGILVPRMIDGKQVGWRRKVDGRALFNVLRARLRLEGRLDFVR
ncbi:MAG TPA: hypothetical protein VF655_09110 [Allosphingosinicella sp.]|jgi:hypothetical protein